MLRSLLTPFIFLLLLVQAALGQQLPEAPRVSRTLQVANMRLHLTEKARQDIQADVDALYRSPKYLMLKLERVNLYMPIIEPILIENGVPEDIKYLVIQESALISDAVSSSNAVGFWQFKDFTAAEYGMRVDRNVDERMNIVSSTHAATRYLLKSQREFDNWIYSLLSYNIGLGGAMRSLDKGEYGAREMRIDHSTHWYIKKFLSHKVAFEPILGKHPNKLLLYSYTKGADKTLADIAEEFQVAVPDVENYNKWLRSRRIPSDKAYTVIVPLAVDETPELLVSADEPAENDKTKGENSIFGRKQQYPQPKRKSSFSDLRLIQLNGLDAVIAREGDTQQSLAELGGLNLSRFQRYNEIALTDGIQAGQAYYFQRKRRKARVYEHVVKAGESLWDVAQQYGIRVKKIRQKNRMEKEDAQLRAGRVLWLRFIRPRNKEIEYREVPQPMQKEIRLTSNRAQAEDHVIEEKKATTRTEAAFNRVSRQPEAREAEAKVMVTVTEPEAEVAGALEKTDSLPERSSPEAVALQEMPAAPTADSLEARKVEEVNSTIQLTDETEEVEWQNDAFEENQDETVVHTHEVQAGETLYALSKKYGVSVSELIAWNKLAAHPTLSIGQKLKVYGGQGESADSQSVEEKVVKQQLAKNSAAAPVYHTVEAGESMYRVARLYEVTIKDIMTWNNKENFNVKVGEKLIVGYAAGQEDKINKAEELR